MNARLDPPSYSFLVKETYESHVYDSCYGSVDPFRNLALVC